MPARVRPLATRSGAGEGAGQSEGDARMILTVLGLLLWTAAHLFKRLAPGPASGNGDRPRGLVALASLAAIVLMVIGYRGWDGDLLWVREGWMTPVNNAAMLVAVYLFAASGHEDARRSGAQAPAADRRADLGGLALLVNGDVPSLVLFGGLGLWALVSILLINRAGPRARGTGPAPAGNRDRRAGGRRDRDGRHRLYPCLVQPVTFG